VSPRRAATLRWTLTVIAPLLLAAWYVSLRWTIDWTVTDRVRISLVAGCLQWERAPARFYEHAPPLTIQRERVRYPASWNPIGHRPWGKWSAHRIAFWALAPLPAAAMVLAWVQWLRARPLRAQARRLWEVSRHPAAICAIVIGSCTVLGSIALTGVSLWWRVEYWGTDLNDRWIAQLGPGGFHVSHSAWGFSTGPTQPTGLVLQRRSTARWMLVPTMDLSQPPSMGWSGSMTIPFWLVAVVTAIPTVFIARWYKRTGPRGLCPTCHYPRTGLTPTSPCPECGTPAPSSPRRGAGL